MKVPFRLPTHRLALGLLLLGSCTKIAEQPVPDANHLGQPMDIQSLRRQFVEKHYDEQLTQQPNGWTWTPRWEQASQKTTPKPATYVYVPLEPSTLPK